MTVTGSTVLRGRTGRGVHAGVARAGAWLRAAGVRRGPAVAGPERGPGAAGSDWDPAAAKIRRNQEVAGAGAQAPPRPAAATDPVTAAPPAEPSEKLQIRALQALCRQVFGFRLAMIVLSAPAALLNAAPGLGARLVGAAVVVTFMVSYVLFRDWERFGPLLLRHPSLLAADTLFGSLLLISAGPDTTLAYVSVCTPLLAGLVYGWRGAACFASLQSLILLLVHATLKADRHAPVAEALLLPGLCVIAGAMGSTLRNLMLRFGTATQALTTVQTRLAAAEAVSAERARLAREMHDSVAKTLYGVALAADGLAATASSAAPDPARVREQAELVSRSARRAAAESRELLTDLRRDQPDRTPLWQELAHRASDFTRRTGLRVTCGWEGREEAGLPLLPDPLARHVLAIVTEALENAHRHASATRVDLRAAVDGHLLRVTVHDDGRGLPPGTTLQELRGSGHFGLLGMVERAAQAGARIRVGRGTHERGTEVRLEIPLLAPPPESRPA
ncbi:two-component sensor histidine kinase [Streptomyces argyrophyllae]|uniref:Two-component sensor histidine kinase n=1 Tax=Streptomyces argyrophylli TaxID=2726118 RepID=A0A6M4PW95_9ACTN|nr:two-component sensor histidine kinase [Streptomyces argyrophyllae]